MKFTGLPLNPTPRVLRQFAAAWLVVFIIAALRAFAHKHQTSGSVFCFTALIGLAGLLKPGTVRWLFSGSMVITFPIGWCVTQITLAMMFYLILTPLALFFRLKGRDELQLKSRPDQSTFWVERGEPPAPEKYLSQF